MTSKISLERPHALGRVLNFAAGASTTMCQNLLEPHGLTLAQWVILSALWRRDELLVTEIAEYVGRNVPAVSRIIDRMVERGLIERKTSQTDRRAVKVSLTEKGRALDYLAAFYKDVNEKLLEGLSDAESSALFDLLLRVDANARRYQK
ncbi:MAG: MarR family transcriptional regulator [Hyphomicrobiales bacterium]